MSNNQPIFVRPGYFFKDGKLVGYQGKNCGYIIVRNEKGLHIEAFGNKNRINPERKFW